MHRQGWISEVPTRITHYWLLQHFNFGDSVSPQVLLVRMPDSDEDCDKGLCHEEHDVSSGVLFHTTWCLLVQRKWEERRHLSPLGSETLQQAVCVQKFPVDRITLVNQDELGNRLLLTNTSTSKQCPKTLYMYMYCILFALNEQCPKLYAWTLVRRPKSILDNSYCCQEMQTHDSMSSWTSLKTKNTL